VSFYSASDKEIVAVPRSIGDMAVARFFGVPVERVSKVRDKATKLAAKSNEGRRTRPTFEPIDDEPSKKQPSVADAVLMHENGRLSSMAMLTALLAYHAKYNPKSMAAPLYHTGSPR
jgi:hypothetical protein